MEYKKGDRVKHPIKDDWGLGKVLENSDGTTVRVFFVDVGEKILSLRHVQLSKVEGSEAESDIFDNLKISKSTSGIIVMGNNFHRLSFRKGRWIGV